MTSTPLTFADLSPQVRLHLSRWLTEDDFDRNDYVSARIVHGIAILKDKDGDLSRYYLGYEIDHDPAISSGYYARWTVGREGFSTLEDAKHWVDLKLAAKAGGTP